ncbi:MAG TPA: MAPEG family protein [Noviherbaspirillum sp.]|uniref:MAPEG family protein n=1 Tax=Noviherbaspirillum sp. TaxID=1926288 RepID=UPI002F92E58A
MDASALAVLGYVGWTLILIIGIEIHRSVVVLREHRPPNSFRPDGSDVSAFAHRLARAHANCYESFPLIGGLLLLALATGQSSITNPLAPWMLAARVAQSSTHLISNSTLAAQVRFAFFSAQLVIAAWWVMQLLRLQ